MGDGGTITIHGGEVTATGGKNLSSVAPFSGAGIGGGSGFGNSGNITIYGGEVTATGGGRGAGIGGGSSDMSETIAIHGGLVTATGGLYGAGIGGGGADAGVIIAGGDIAIYGGVVTATGGQYGAGIGGGYGGEGGTITIEAGTVTAAASDDAQAVGCGSDVFNSGSLTIYESARVTAGLQQSVAVPAAATDRVNACRNPWAHIEPCTEHVFNPDGMCAYCGTAFPLYDGQTTLADGWYVVNAGMRVEGRIEVSGDVGILLCDGVELTAAQGFHVAGANRLTVAAQSDDRATAGKLTIPSPDGNVAGIGGNDLEDGGTVVVNGGVIDVTGGYKAAAIGGGRSGAGGVITINGGFVTAIGAQSGTGIGGGTAINADYTGGSVGTVTINGGEVTATGGSWGAGIGGAGGSNSGNGSSGGTVIINGGTVTNTGGQYGAGIGGGRYAGCVAVEIRSETVTAVAGDGAQAIGNGSGWNGDVGSLAIGGMSVFASAAATTPVATEQREGVCRSDWAKAELCPNDFSPQGVYQHCGADGGPVEYLDPTDADSPGKVCEAYASFAGQTSLTEGWYVARVAVQAQERIEIAGEVNLILCDGATLTAVQGFHVAEGNRLVIWGQSVGGSAGRLTVSGPDEFLAGIGGNANESGGAVAVYGGALSVDGGNLAAGIGGGYKGAGGMVEIAGGQVVATAGGDGVQAIGRGWGGDGAGSLGIGGMRVFASVAATEPVESAQRETVCRSAWAKIEPCPHEYENGFCCWCGGEIYGYAAWAVENGIVGAWDAKDVGGVANVFRYAFDKPAGLFILLGITIENGQVVILTPPLVNTEGYAFSILATDTVDGGGAAATPYPLDPSGRTVIDEPGKTCRFFRLRAVEK